MEALIYRPDVPPITSKERFWHIGSIVLISLLIVCIWMILALYLVDNLRMPGKSPFEFGTIVLCLSVLAAVCFFGYIAWQEVLRPRLPYSVKLEEIENRWQKEIASRSKELEDEVGELLEYKPVPIAPQLTIFDFLSLGLDDKPEGKVAVWVRYRTSRDRIETKTLLSSRVFWREDKSNEIRFGRRYNKDGQIELTDSVTITIAQPPL